MDSQIQQDGIFMIAETNNLKLQSFERRCNCPIIYMEINKTASQQSLLPLWWLVAENF